MDEDNERLLDEIIEAVVGDKLVAVMPTLLAMKKDAERYRLWRSRGVPTDQGFHGLRWFGQALDSVTDAAVIDGAKK